MKPWVFGWFTASLLCAEGVLARSYVVGVEQQAFQPHYWQDEQGEYRGFAREVLDLFARDAGIELHYQAFPVTQLTGEFLAGEVDLKYPDSPQWGVESKAGNHIRYSRPVVAYVDGVLVPPKRLGQGLDRLSRLALVEGWTPHSYQARIDGGQTRLVHSTNLGLMIRQALRHEADGAYYNLVVATFYLDSIRARPGALVFDPALPHSRGNFHVSSLRHPELIERFDRFLGEHAAKLAELKARHGVEANLDSEYLGLEQWRVEFLERQKDKRQR